MFESESDDLRTIKALPLWQAFLAAVIAPIVIALVFAILGAQKNALLLQIELVVVAIAFCLTGILARSKLLGLLSIFAAPISWVVLFFMSTLTEGWIVNPYGLISELAGPLASIAKSDLIQPESTDQMSLVIQIAIVADLAILEFLALFLGFFLSTLATGFWTKKGDFSILSAIMKPIAAIFTILILITVPFVYHGVSNFADGGISLVAGAGEFIGVFGVEFEDLDGGDGGSAQAVNISFDWNNQTLINELSEACERAAKWFARSAYKFDHVQGNYLINMLLPLLPEEMGGINMKEIDKLLDISEILALVAQEVPDLLLGYFSLADGFNRTFTVLEKSDIGGGIGASTDELEATYDDDFNAGLENISTAIFYFNRSKEGVLQSLETAIEIVTDVFVGEGGDLEVIVSIVEEAYSGYGTIIEVAEGAVDFLNATYKTTLAVEDLGDANFEDAHTWMGSAANDLSNANKTLQAIDISELDPNSVLPFYGTVKIITDMTELLTYFARAATNGTECYMEIEDIVQEINALDFSGGDLDTISTNLGILSGNVSDARDIFNAAQSNIGSATQLSSRFILPNNTYGKIIDGSLKPMLSEFNTMLNQFYTNVTEISYLLAGLDNTLASAYSFTEGLNLFNSTYNDIRLDVGADGVAFFNNFSVNPNIERSKALMDFAIENATDGYEEIEKTSVIPADITTDWQITLIDPYPDPDSSITADPKSIAGLALGAKDAIEALQLFNEFAQQESNFDLINTLFDNMDDVGFEQIFGGG